MMNRYLILLLGCWLACPWLNSLVVAQEVKQQQSTDQVDVPATQLRTLDGQVVTLPPREGFAVVCFLGIECPLAKLYAPRFNQLSHEYSSEGFQFVAVNSNRQDSTAEWRQFAESNKLTMPLVKDHDNLIADVLSVVRNPDVVVVDSAGKIRYRGRVDDQYSPGVVRPKVSREDLRIALTELASGKPVSKPVTKPEGCLIGRVKKIDKPATVTYAKHIAPILQKNCIECHRSGEIGPFAMVDYDEVVGWADMIVETIDNGRMPPWHADPSVGKFNNARGLTAQEKQLIRTWVDEGAQLGDTKDLPEPAKFTQGWRLPKAPDQVIAMSTKPYQVPADGSVDYQYFVVDPGFETDKWVAAAEVIPGNPAVVHHSIVFIRPPDGQATSGLSWLHSYVPGQVPGEFVQSRARKIPAGSKLVFQQHYTPNGQPQTDLTKIGLIFVDEEQVQEEHITLVALNQEFEIEPNQANLTVKADASSLPKDGKLLGISPHMHFRGKSFVATADDGQTEQPLLSVPNYDFNWQHNYVLSEPLPLDQFKKLHIEVVFDNSAENPFNPDPSQYVIWGDQTWEEMAIGFFDVAIPHEKAKPEPKPKPKQKVKVAATEAVVEKPEYSQETLQRAAKHAQGLFGKSDRDGDGRLVRDEMPRMNRWLFKQFDADQDGFVTLEEAEASARDAYHLREKNNK